jgi:cytochrome P450
MTDTSTGRELVDPSCYGENGPPHDLFRRLRAESPVHWCEMQNIESFWAITRHEDIRFISSHPELFISEPGITPRPKKDPIEEGQAFATMRVVIGTDGVEHRDLRKVAMPHLTPRALATAEASMRKSAKQLVDELAKDGGEGETDLAMNMAVRHPLRVLCKTLGVPEDQEETVRDLSSRIFAPDDDELGSGATSEDFERLGQEFVQLFLPIISDRRANPTDDLASVIANGTIRGEALGPMETLGYYLIIFSAGHDTTKNSLAGGFRALIENSEQFRKVQSDASLSASCVEEIVRWTTAVNYMKRTATQDVEVNGQKIREGEAAMMFYASANRDESVFEDPYTFDVLRKPNRHLGFGHGEHFCMGAHFARRSQIAIIEELARRVEHWEIIGEPEWISSSFVVGLKHLPVRYRIRKSD